MTRIGNADSRHIKIACEHCSGSGRRSLTEMESNTRIACGEEWSSTADIRERLRHIQKYDSKPTALINRLNALVARGLVERKPINAKLVQWRATRARDIRGEAIEIQKWERSMRGP